MGLLPYMTPILSALLSSTILLSNSATLSLSNKCNEPIWPAIQPSAGKPILALGGFLLQPNQSSSLHLPPSWSGRIWARQGCSFPPSSSTGFCSTGDCSGNLHCNGLGGTPPATLAELTLASSPHSNDFYDVSLVDGFNLAISLRPFRGVGLCAVAGCVSDLNRICPRRLAVRDGARRVVGCKSACSAFGSPRYCCTGSFGSPQLCKPTVYSKLFKSACPRAYSYAFDDPTSVLTCMGASYVLTFCPPLPR